MTLKAENLKKRYSNFELHIPHLKIEDGEIFGLVERSRNIFAIWDKIVYIMIGYNS